jgi:hypothetical protein
MLKGEGKATASDGSAVSTAYDFVPNTSRHGWRGMRGWPLPEFSGCAALKSPPGASVVHWNPGSPTRLQKPLAVLKPQPSCDSRDLEVAELEGMYFRKQSRPRAY